MRKRKWQTVVFILLIVMLSFAYLRINHLYFTAEEVFYACERGLRYTPSEEIAFTFERKNGGKVLVGRKEDRLFVVPAERSHIFFWRMSSGEGIDVSYRCEFPLDGYFTYDWNYLGLCQDAHITEISLMIGSRAEKNWREYTFPVQEGIVFIKAEQIFGEEGLDMREDGTLFTEDSILYTEGRNAAGEVVYWSGDDAVAEALRKGDRRPPQNIF